MPINELLNSRAWAKLGSIVLMAAVTKLTSEFGVQLF